MKKLDKNFRVYQIAENKKLRQAIGTWTDKGKIYKDNINFYYTPTLLKAKQKAMQILNTTSELGIAIESIHPKTLYLVYRDKTEVLSFFKSVNVKYKLLSKRIKKQNPSYTIENTPRGNFIYAYNHQRQEVKSQSKPKAIATGKAYIQGQEVY